MAEQKEVQTYEQLYQENSTLLIMHDEAVFKYSETYAKLETSERLCHKLRSKLALQNDTEHKQNETFKNTISELQSNMISLAQDYKRKYKTLNAQIETLETAVIDEQQKNKQLLETIKTLTEQYGDGEYSEFELKQEITDLNNIISAKDKFHTQLQTDNDTFRDQLEDYSLELAIFKSQNQDTVIETLNDQIERLQSEIKQYKQNSVHRDSVDLLAEHTECEEMIQSLMTEKSALETEISVMKKEQSMVKEENRKLIDEFNGVKLQIYSDNDSDSVGSIFNPCDDEKIGDVLDEYTNDEFCMKLEEDLENYRSDQRRKKKLAELKLFHGKKEEIIWNWENSLFQNVYKTLWESLMDELEETYENEEVLEEIVYKILFDIVIECYDLLESEYRKEFTNATVIDLVFLNMGNFYGLMTRNKSKKRIGHIYTYINSKVERIYKCVASKHCDVKDIFKPQLSAFVVQCCEIIWSVLHYQCHVYPMNSGIDTKEIKYNDITHKIVGDVRSDIVKYCVFPALRNGNKYETKMCIICKESL